MHNVFYVQLQTWISGNPSAFPIAVAVKSLPPLPSVVTAHDFRAFKKKNKQKAFLIREFPFSNTILVKKINEKKH